MRISKAGISFNYHNDEVTWLWPWKREGFKFHSSLYDRFFADLNHYWMYVGILSEAFRKEKVVGYSEEEILLQWAAKEFVHHTVIVLRHVNVEMKSTTFWKSVDIFAKKQLVKDVVVLFFSTPKEAQNVLHSIAPEFAEAYMFVSGKLFDSNTERKIEENRNSNPGFR